MLEQQNKLPQLTRATIETLQNAYESCADSPTGGLILSAMVMIKQVHEELATGHHTMPESDPAEYCAAI